LGRKRRRGEKMTREPEQTFIRKTSVFFCAQNQEESRAAKTRIFGKGVPRKARSLSAGFPNAQYRQASCLDSLGHPNTACQGRSVPETLLKGVPTNMRKRNIQIIVRLDKDENERLKKRVKKSGLSQEAYLRHLINDLVPTDAPPPDYHSMMRELRAIGNNLNQVARKAHVLNAVDVKRYEEAVAALNKAVIEITNAVMLPRKIERNTERKIE
jgi:hypothetical protein